MKKIIPGILLILIGLALLGGAAYIFMQNQQENEAAGTGAQTALEALQEMLPTTTAQQTTAPEVTEESVPETTLDPEMPVVEVDGYEYIGYLDLPRLEMTLPIMSEWDSLRLQIAPCRQFGSSRTDDLVIAGHNYASHFGRLNELDVGDTVRFTDMEGVVSTYTICRVETLRPTQVEDVQNSGHDLVLYTCTYGGRSRVVLFCDRKENPDL